MDRDLLFVTEMFRGKIRILELMLAGMIVCGGCARTPEQTREKYIASGQKMMEKGDYRRAILEFSNAVRAKPGEAESHYQLALAYLKSGRPNDAVRELRSATELNSKHSAAQVKLSEMMLKAGNPELARQAEDRLRSVLSERPDDGDARFAMAEAEWELGNPEDAEKGLREILRESPRNVRSSLGLAVIRISKKDWKGAEEVLRNAVAQSPKSAPAALALGIFFINTNRLPEAESQLQAAAAMDRTNPRPLLNLAAVELRMQKKDAAEESYKQIAALPGKKYKLIYGEYLVQKGDLNRAVAEFDKLLKSSPDDSLARSRLAAAYITQKRFGDAERLLDSALRRNPKDLQALLERGQLYIRQGKIAEANADVTAAVRYEPTSAQAHLLLALVYKARRNSLLQRQELGNAVRLKSTLLAARIELVGNLIQSNAGKSALNTINEAPPEQRKLLTVIAWRNWALLAAGDQTECAKGVAEGLARARIPEFLLQDATVKLQQKDFDGCRRVVDEFLKQSPEDLRAFQLLIRSYVAQNRRQEVAEKLRAYVPKQSNSAPLLEFLGNWLMENGQSSEARTAFESAKKADPLHIGPELALAKMDLGGGKGEAARQRLAPIVSANARNNDARLLLAMADEAIGNYTSAIENYEKLAQLDSPNALVMNNLAYLLAGSNLRSDEALKYAQEAEVLSPDNATVEETLGWVYYVRGDPASAVKHLEYSVRLYPTARRKYHLAMAYAKAGTTQIGLQTLNDAFKMDPNLPEAKMALQLFEEIKTKARF